MIEILSNDCFMIGAFIWSSLMTLLIAGSFKFLIKETKDPLKYEFCFISCGRQFVDEQVIDLQNKGWEVAGPVVIKPQPHGGFEYVYIPFKRLL